MEMQKSKPLSGEWESVEPNSINEYASEKERDSLGAVVLLLICGKKVRIGKYDYRLSGSE